ncbi:S-layer homology domain-containing protein [Paenibacillus sp. FSL P4-0081]|uniref:S-layer homology domain-containing protein n=1 Tax=Paenibacillus sp. FSL P4-0081 TaxID=1536769 RepID=UPI0006945FD6|nr:S-layer homology domain-containing protein [Paenibacillus sp. FSL P4-0081]
MSDMSYPTKEKSQFMNVQGGEKKVMKKILSVALSTAMAFSMFASVAFGETAKATPQQAFDALAAKGILNGYPDGQAHLEKDLTRAEFAKIVTKLFGLTEVTGKLSYKDKGYTATNWAVPYIEAVTAANLMQGKDTVKGLFDYNGKVTVEEVAAVLFRALKLEQPTTTDNSASVWAKGYAQAVINAGLVAQTTNFKANATRSLVVETAYAVDQMSVKPTLTVASAEAVSPTKVVVTFSDKTTADVELTTALVAGVETTINFKHLEKDYTAKVTLQAPKVVSATAPNAKQVVVKFNRAIDVDTLAESSKVIDGVVKVTKVGSKDDEVSNAYVTFSADNTEATITLPGVKALKGNYTVVVSDAVKTTAGEAIPAFTTLLTVADTVAPTVASVTSSAKATTKDVYVTFSEPVKTTGIVAYVNGSAASTTVQNDTYTEFKLSGVTLDSGKTYDVSLLNVTDFAGNVATPNPIKTTVTVVSDVAAPVIKSVTAVSDKFIEVEFDKNVDRASLVGNVRLLNAVGESQGTFSVITTANGKKFTLQSPLSSFPSTGTFTGSVVFGATVKDTLGNTLGTASSQAITFTKDTVAPTVTGVTYTTSGSVKGIKLTFSEDVVNSGVGSVVLINNKTGQSTSIANTTSGSGKSFILTAVNVEAGEYTVRLPEGLFKDKSFSANKLAATVLTVTIGSATTDGDAPVLFNNGIVINDSAKAAVTDAVYGDATVTVDLKDASGLNTASVLEINSYTLDDKALPAGSYVTIQTLTDAGVVTTYSSSPKFARATIHIPSSSVTETKADYKFVVNGVTDTSGNPIEAVSKTGKLTSRTSPVFNSAVVSSGNSYELILGFSKEVTVLPESDLQFFINNDAITSNIINPDYYTITKIVNGSDKGKWSVTFSKKAIDSSAALADTLDLNSNNVNRIIVKIAGPTTVTAHDADGNVLTDGTEISAK